MRGEGGGEGGRMDESRSRENLLSSAFPFISKMCTISNIPYIHIISSSYTVL